MKYLAALLLLLLAALTLRADVFLFYGGDFDPNNGNANGLANENDALIGGDPYGAATYQSAVNTGQAGPSDYIPYWIVGGLFTNNLSSLNPSSAYWEIRTGMSEGNGGTLIASGTATGDGFSHTPTGRSGFGYTEYSDTVSFASVWLEPGTYWFAVVPNDPNSGGRSFNSNTFGLNAVGTQVIDEQFWNSAYFGANFTNANNEGVFHTFSSGVIGSYFIPEPSSLVMLGSGLLGVAATLRRKLAGRS